MKYVTFKMSKGEDITLPYEQAKRVLEGREQMVMVNNEKGDWTGIVVNKAYVVSSDINVEESRPDRITRKDRLIEGPDCKKLNPDDFIPGFIKKKREHDGERNDRRGVTKR
jgi:hypothetical protein